MAERRVLALLGPCRRGAHGGAEEDLGGLRGVDVVDLTLGHAAEIAAFEARQAQTRGWLDRLP